MCTHLPAVFFSFPRRRYTACLLNPNRADLAGNDVFYSVRTGGRIYVYICTQNSNFACRGTNDSAEATAVAIKLWLPRVGFCFVAGSRKHFFAYCPSTLRGKSSVSARFLRGKHRRAPFMRRNRIHPETIANQTRGCVKRSLFHKLYLKRWFCGSDFHITVEAAMWPAFRRQEISSKLNVRNVGFQKKLNGSFHGKREKIQAV